MMRIIALDDEKLALDNLTQAIREAAPRADIFAFRKAKDALEFIQDNYIDAIFMDIKLKGANGIEVAEQMKTYLPKLNVIFCTGYDEFTGDAFKVHASGYLTKPITAEAVAEELAVLRHPVRDQLPLLTFRVYGGFDAFDRDGKKLEFKRVRSKELLAILAYYKGTPLSAEDLSAILWASPDYQWSDKIQSYFRVLLSELKRVLRLSDADDVIEKTKEGYYVNPCYVDYDESGKGIGEFMSGYDWAKE